MRIQRLILIIVLSILAIPIQAQVGSEKPPELPYEEMRFFGSISLNYTTIADRNAFLMGSDGMYILREQWALGFSAKVFLNQSAPNLKLGSQYFSSFYTVGIYAGVKGAYYIPIQTNISLGLPLMLGFGGVAYTGDYYYSNYYQNSIEAQDGYAIAEPGMEVVFRFNESFQFALLVDYRLTTPVKLKTPDPDKNRQMVLAKPQAVNGLAIGLALKFGTF